jgi:hypothetical protein
LVTGFELKGAAALGLPRVPTGRHIGDCETELGDPSRKRIVALDQRRVQDHRFGALSADGEHANSRVMARLRKRQAEDQSGRLDAAQMAARPRHGAVLDRDCKQVGVTTGEPQCAASFNEPRAAGIERHVLAFRQSLHAAWCRAMYGGSIRHSCATSCA